MLSGAADRVQLTWKKKKKKNVLKLPSLHSCCWNLSPFLPLRDGFVGLAKTLNATQILLPAWAHIFYPAPACNARLCTHARAKKMETLLFSKNAADVKPYWISPHTLPSVILSCGRFLVYRNVKRDQKVGRSVVAVIKKTPHSPLFDPIRNRKQKLLHVF